MQNENMKITKDGFIWKIVSNETAKKIWYNNVLPLYVLHSDDAETLIESLEQFIDAIENNLYIGVEVGKIEVEPAKEILTNKGYYTNNLWHVDDVKNNYQCTDDEVCQDILDGALQNDATMNQIWFAIRMEAENEGLKEIEE